MMVKDVSGLPAGYDIESRHPQSGRTKYIEVKSRKIEGRLQLTPNEYISATKKGPNYYIYIVRSRNRIEYIRNPTVACTIRRRTQPV